MVNSHENTNIANRWNGNYPRHSITHMEMEFQSFYLFLLIVVSQNRRRRSDQASAAAMIRSSPTISLQTRQISHRKNRSTINVWETKRKNTNSNDTTLLALRHFVTIAEAILNTEYTEYRGNDSLTMQIFFHFCHLSSVASRFVHCIAQLEIARLWDRIIFQNLDENI